MVCFLALLTGCTKDPASSPGDTTGSSGFIAPGIRCTGDFPSNRIVSSSVPRDGIPSIDQPKFVAPALATLLDDSPDELVLGVNFGDDPRAYPYRILDRHEVVNDWAFNQPFVVTYCPLTGVGIVFDARLQGQPATFGVSGLLFENNLILYERLSNTRSNFSQMLFCGIDGQFEGLALTTLPAWEMSWAAWRALFPETRVLAPATGIARSSYTVYPYASVDYKHSTTIFFPTSFDDHRLHPKAKVHGVALLNDTRVYPVAAFPGPMVINDRLQGNPLVIVADGSHSFVQAYSALVGGQTLHFTHLSSTPDFPFLIQDEQTGSTWNVLGRAVDGPLTGTQLARPTSYNAYWFAWAALFPASSVYRIN